MTRFVVGRRVFEVDVGQVADLVACHERVTIDVGTGDGRAVLDAAAREPASLVLGLDANAAAMAEASRRAAGPARKGGRPNARFIVAAAETPPPELRGTADLVTVRFPWGSLLRGVLGQDEAVACGVAGLLAPGGSLEGLLAPSARDGLDGVPIQPEAVVEAAAAALAPHGLCLSEGRAATDDEIAASGSTWAKRLVSANRADRSVVLVRLSRAPASVKSAWSDASSVGRPGLTPVPRSVPACAEPCP